MKSGGASTGRDLFGESSFRLLVLEGGWGVVDDPERHFGNK